VLKIFYTFCLVNIVIVNVFNQEAKIETYTLEQALEKAKTTNPLILNNIENYKDYKYFIKSTFYDLIYHNNKLLLINKLTIKSNDFSNIIKLQYELGDISLLEKVRAETQIAEIKNIQTQEYYNLQISENKLKILINSKNEIIPSDNILKQLILSDSIKFRKFADEDYFNNSENNIENYESYKSAKDFRNQLYLSPAVKT